MEAFRKGGVGSLAARSVGRALPESNSLLVAQPKTG